MELVELSCDAQLEYLNNIKSIKLFTDKVIEVNSHPLKSSNAINTMQINVGKVCNMACKHCHVGAGPHRTESMSQEVMAKCLQVLEENNFKVLDITGGAPELNPHFPWLVAEAKKLGRHVIIRTNLTVLDLAEYAHLPEFYAEQKVELASSLPYYSEKDADRQRGDGVFHISIKVLKKLNELGFGKDEGDLKLNLVYNPGGAFLPPSQKSIEADYRRVLSDQHGILFNNLYAFANFPVGRFLSFLHDSSNLQRYMERLAAAFNPATLNNLMCREQISVGWDGYIYDCDFNQMLGMNCSPKHISEFSFEGFQEREILMNNHCYACTAGSGSSCGGAVV